MTVKIGDLPPITTIADQDLFAVVLVGADTTNAIRFDDIVANAQQRLFSVLIPGTDYTATPAGPGEITMLIPHNIPPGSAIEIVQGVVSVYGTVTDSGPAFVKFSGPDISAADVDELRVQSATTTVQADLIIPAKYTSLGPTIGLIERETASKFIWRQPPAYLTLLTAAHLTQDTGASQPTINVTVNGSVVVVADLSLGTSGTFVQNADGGIDKNTYQVAFGDLIEIELATVGTNNDSEDMSVSISFVLDLEQP